jgi:hypothetical protein
MELSNPNELKKMPHQINLRRVDEDKKQRADSGDREGYMKPRA